VALAPGTRLGPYEVVAQIGAGGMGEVYKGRDTRLDRTVAIKVLPAPLAGDRQFRDRFDREAKAISSLDDPHICALYDVGTYNGTAYLVMPLLQGEPLDVRLTKGALPFDLALEYAIQIAGALEKAHRAGIVHRDLKPGNVMLTKAGAVLLDFGLAKATAALGSSAALSMLPTTPANLTAQGTILGTFQYMAPEQLEGSEADTRTDLFAFGALLYEMVTGQKAFEGKSQASLIAAIMHAEPPPIASSQPLWPPAFERVVRRCLAKSPENRWQSAADLRAELRWIADSQVTPPTDQSLESRPARTRPFLQAGILLVLIGTVAVLSLFLWRLTGVTEPRAMVRFTVGPPNGWSFDDALGIGGAGYPSLSPDGRLLAFAARDRAGASSLWIRAIDDLEPRQLASTEDAGGPFWSPDSQWIGFFAQGALKKVAVAGGLAQSLGNREIGGGGTWSASGAIVFQSGYPFKLARAAAGGGAIAPLPASISDGNLGPQFLPDGQHLLFFVPGRSEHSGVFVGSVEGRDIARVVAADAPAVYSRSGHLLFIQSGTLLAQPFDLATRRLTGEPTAIAEHVLVRDDPTIPVSVSNNAVLAYRTGSFADDKQLMWIDRTGKVLASVGESGRFFGPNLSPDSRRIVIHRHENGGGDVWVGDVEHGTWSRLTFDATLDNFNPLWSPDGRRVVYGNLRDGRWGIYAISADGAGTEERLLESDRHIEPMDWSRDGQFLIYSLNDPNTGADVWALPLAGRQQPFPVLHSAFNESQPQLSPDGRWLAYDSDQTGRPEVYVSAFPNGAGKWQISTTGGVSARWRADGRELYFMSPGYDNGKMMAVDVRAEGSSVQPGVPHALFDSGHVAMPHGNAFYPGYAVSADGQRFLIPRREHSAQPLPITVVVNWTALLKK
jgi:serine/threonine protein kinase/Tol biopolymer transport system component